MNNIVIPAAAIFVLFAGWMGGYYYGSDEQLRIISDMCKSETGSFYSGRTEYRCRPIEKMTIREWLDKYRTDNQKQNEKTK